METLVKAITVVPLVLISGFSSSIPIVLAISKVLALAFVIMVPGGLLVMLVTSKVNDLRPKT